MVLSLSVVYQFANAQNCQGDKVLMSKGWKGACGCNTCQKACVPQSEVQAYIAMGWYLGQCANVGKLCCGIGWFATNSENGKIKTKLIDINSGTRSVSISFSLSKQSEVKLQVFDMTGRCVATVANKIFKENSHEIIWDASRINPGIYFLSMNTDDYNETRKIAVTN